MGQVVFKSGKNTLKQLTGRSEDVTDWQDISLIHNSLVKVQRPAKQLWNILIPAPNQQLGPVLLLLLAMTRRLLPLQRIQHTHQHDYTVNNSSVPHLPLSSTHAPPSLPNTLFLCSSLILASTSRAQGHGVDIAYPSLNELIKGAVSKVLLRFVYLCITGAPQITQTKGLSELLI